MVLNQSSQSRVENSCNASFDFCASSQKDKGLIQFLDKDLLIS